jgi:protein S
LFRFSAEFDFRTYDSAGIILYAESLDHSTWLLIALRDGKIEVQFKNEYATQITTGGNVINNGQWNVVCFTDFINISHLDVVCIKS